MGPHGNDYIWPFLFFDKAAPTPQRGFGISDSGCNWTFAGHVSVWSGPKTPGTSGGHIMGREGANMPNAWVFELATIDGWQFMLDSPIPGQGQPPIHQVCALTMPNFRDVPELHFHGQLVLGDNPYAIAKPEAPITIVSKGVQISFGEPADPPSSTAPAKWISVKFAGDPKEYRMPLYAV